MNDLISRSTAIGQLEDADIVVTGVLGRTLLADYTRKIREGYIDILKNVPSEDASWTRYGIWRTVGKTEYGSIIRECTVCGVQKAGRVKSAYCPDCGAKMGSHDDHLDGQDSFVI